MSVEIIVVGIIALLGILAVATPQWLKDVHKESKKSMR